MTIEEYAAAKEAIIRKMIADLLWIFSSMLVPGITPLQWLRFIQMIYPRVKQARDEATVLARQFYDAHRVSQLGSQERVDFYRDAHYPQEWLAQSLQPVYDNLREAQVVDDEEDGATVSDDSDQDVVSDQVFDDYEDVSNRVAKVVEDGARRTLLNGVQNDPAEVRWARYDPRPPTCAFCTVLISRGPVYASTETAGSTLAQSRIEELYSRNDLTAINKSMKDWHPGCTCIVVPVYKLENYPTEKQEEAALDLYIAGRKRAQSGNFKKILKGMREIAKERDKTPEERLPQAA